MKFTLMFLLALSFSVFSQVPEDVIPDMIQPTSNVGFVCMQTDQSYYDKKKVSHKGYLKVPQSKLYSINKKGQIIPNKKVVAQITYGTSFDYTETQISAVKQKRTTKNLREMAKLCKKYIDKLNLVDWKCVALYDNDLISDASDINQYVVITSPDRKDFKVVGNVRFAAEVSEEGEVTKWSNYSSLVLSKMNCDEQDQIKKEKFKEVSEKINDENSEDRLPEDDGENGRG